MNVNSNPTASQQNKKKLPVSKIFPFIAGVVDTGDQPLLSNISANFEKIWKMARIGYSRARGKLIHEKSLKSKISGQTLFKSISTVLTLRIKILIKGTWWGWKRASWGEGGMIGRFEEGKKQLSTPLVPIPFSSLNKMTRQTARNSNWQRIQTISHVIFSMELSHVRFM